MRARVTVLVVAPLLLALVAATAHAWGDETHKAISRGAVTALPDELRPFFTANIEFLAAHSLDPDYLPNRTMAQRAEHFLDLDDYGQFPFAELPHDQAEAVRKFGEETVVKRGLLPWAIQREHDRLARALKAGDWTEARLAAAFLAHFVADAHMPLHATANYDGQATNQRGIHFRIEDELMARYHAGRLALPAGAPVTATPSEWAFAQLRRSYLLVAPLMVAEMKARQAAPLDSDTYYVELERHAGSILAPLPGEAAAALAGFIASAWTQAGKPALPPARVVVLIHETPARDEKGSSKDVSLLAAINGKLGAWDASALLTAGAPRRLWQFGAAFRAAGDGSDGAATPTGSLRDATAQAVNALRQFPAAARHVVIVATGKSLAAAATDVAKALKGTNVRALLVIAGPGDEDARAEEAARTAGLSALRCPSPDRLVPILADAWAAALATP